MYTFRPVKTTREQGLVRVQLSEHDHDGIPVRNCIIMNFEPALANALANDLAAAAVDLVTEREVIEQCDGNQIDIQLRGDGAVIASASHTNYNNVVEGIAGNASDAIYKLREVWPTS